MVQLAVSRISVGVNTSLTHLLIRRVKWRVVPVSACYAASFSGETNWFDKYDHSVGKVCTSYTQKVGSNSCFFSPFAPLFWCQHYEIEMDERLRRKSKVKTQPRSDEQAGGKKIDKEPKKKKPHAPHAHSKKRNRVNKQCKATVFLFSLWVPAAYILHSLSHTHRHTQSHLAIRCVCWLHLWPLSGSPHLWVVYTNRCNLWRQTGSWRLHR